MKIQVERESGETQVLEIFAPLQVHEGDQLNRLTSSDGTDHFFTKAGLYDGHGAMSAPLNEGLISQESQ